MLYIGGEGATDQNVNNHMMLIAASPTSPILSQPPISNNARVSYHTDVLTFLPCDCEICKRSIHLLSWQKEWLVGNDPFYGNFWVKLSPFMQKNADFQSIFPRSASAVKPSKNCSIITNRKSTKRFPISLRWTTYVAPKSLKGGSKPQNDRFPFIRSSFHPPHLYSCVTDSSTLYGLRSLILICMIASV